MSTKICNAYTQIQFKRWVIDFPKCPIFRRIDRKYSDCKPLCLQNFAFDKLELESSPLTVAILERNRTDVCWQVFVENSGKFGGISKPIGYLKGLVQNPSYHASIFDHHVYMCGRPDILRIIPCHPVILAGLDAVVDRRLGQISMHRVLSFCDHTKGKYTEYNGKPVYSSVRLRRSPDSYRRTFSN